MSPVQCIVQSSTPLHDCILYHNLSIIQALTRLCRSGHICGTCVSEQIQQGKHESLKLLQTCGCFSSTCTLPPALTTASSTAAATRVMTCCLLAGPGCWGLSGAMVAACFALFEPPRLLYATAGNSSGVLLCTSHERDMSTIPFKSLCYIHACQ
jgi:hypothetical protein